MNELFSPVKIGKLVCKNRFMMAPINSGHCEEGGAVTPEAIAFLKERARQDVALVMAGSVAVSPDGCISGRQMSLFSENSLAGMQSMVREIHAAGAHFGASLVHGGRQTLQALSPLPLIAPSAVPCALVQSNPREMQLEDFERVRNDYVTAAKRAAMLGFDVIELNMGDGFLLNNFLSPRCNLRTDEYGGALAGRMRYPLMVLDALVRSVDIPVTVRLCVNEYLPQGFAFEEALQLAALLEQRGAAAISVTAGSYDSIAYAVPPLFVEPGFLTKQAGELKKAVSIPVILGGRLNDPAQMERVIAQGKADMVAIGRALVADQRFVMKIRNGRSGQVRPCIACNQGCVDLAAAGKSLRCAVNPVAGRELQKKPLPAAVAKKVVVIGGGASGMVAARTAALRGHRVVLLEAEPVLGGMLNVLATLPEKMELLTYRQYLCDELKRLNVEIRHQTLENADDLAMISPDAVVVAAGARQAMAPFPVRNDAELAMAEDVLTGRASTGRSVAVIGGGNVGLQTAKYLCAQGKKVHIVEMKQEIGGGLGLTYYEHEMRFIKNCGVECHMESEVMAVEKGRVLLSKGSIETESVVVALGYYPNIGCAQPIKNRYSQVYTVGDAKEPRRMWNAIAEGYAAGCSV